MAVENRRGIYCRFGSCLASRTIVETPNWKSTAGFPPFRPTPFSPSAPFPALRLSVASVVSISIVINTPLCILRTQETSCTGETNREGQGRRRMIHTRYFCRRRREIGMAASSTGQPAQNITQPDGVQRVASVKPVVFGVRRSCDACGRRKKKCDGGRPCG